MSNTQPFRPRLIVLALFSAALAFNTFTVSAEEEEVQFDLEVLRQRGFNPDVARSFQRGAHFPGGESRVALLLNGKPQHQVMARFDEHGQLCITPALLQQAGLRASVELNDSPLSCVTLNQLWPESVVDLRYQDNLIALTVPEAAIADRSDYDDWVHGGSGALLNYNLQTMGSRSPSWRYQFRQLQTEAGFNAGDWMLRSQQFWYQATARPTRFSHQSLWLQRTLFSQRALLRAGQFNLSGSGLSVGRIRGVQWTPETALNRETGAAEVSGTALSTAVVEIRQLGVLLHSTTVAPGAFTIREFSPLNLYSDLEITQTDSQGQRQQYRLPASVWRQSAASVVHGNAWSFGRVDSPGSRQHPLVATFSHGWQPAAWGSIQSDMLYSPRYQALGLTSTATSGTKNLTLNTIVTRAENHFGASSTLSGSQALSRSASLSVNVTRQEKGYRDLSQTLSERGSDMSDLTQLGSNMSWYHPRIGSFSFSWARSLSQGAHHDDYAQLGWSRRVGSGYLSLSLSRRSGGMQGGHDDSLYLSWQLSPGEKDSLDGWFSHQRTEERTGARYAHQQSADTSWNIAAERSLQGEDKSFSAGLSHRTGWSQLIGSAGYSGHAQRSASLQASGAVALYQRQLLASPWPIGDGFAVVKTGSLKNVSIDTPAGKIRTNDRGYALLPKLTAWGKTSLQLDTHSLRQGVDVSDAAAELSASRGAVTQVDFHVISSRRVLVTVRDERDQPLPARKMVYDESGEFVTVTAEDGTLFLPDAHRDRHLEVELAAGESCQLTLNELPEQPETDTGLYETTRARCVHKAL